MERYFNDANNKIRRADYETIMPISDLNFNSQNNKTIFKIEGTDLFYSNRIMFHIQGELVKKDGGAAYTGEIPIKLIDNFAAFLFDKIEVRKHNQLIDSVNHVGITSTLKSLTTYRTNGDHHSCGLVSTFKNGGAFEVFGTLGHLGLGFFEHIQYPIYKGGLEITFIRAGDNDAILRWTEGTGTAAVTPDEGKINIKSFVLKVPVIHYDPVVKVPLIQELTRLSEKNEFIYDYLQWQCIEKFGVIGSSYTIDITNEYHSIINPLFIIVGLQTKRKNDQKADPSKFDSVNIKNFSVKINGEQYPHELQNLAVTEKNYRLLYDNYISIARLLNGNDDVYLNLDDFISKYPLLVIDTHYHPFSTEKQRSSIQIHLDFTNAVAGPVADKGTTAYVLVVSRAQFSYDVKKNLIKMM